MKTKPSQMLKYSPRVFHFSGIAVWGMAAFLLLLPPSASAKEPSRHRQDSVLLLSPSDLFGDVSTAGDDMYLYEGNAKTYLYVEQDGGKRLLILNVTDPKRALKVAEMPMNVDAPYEFVGALGEGSVLVHFHTTDGEPSEWGRLRFKKLAAPTLSTWIQSSGDIVDPLNNRIVNAGSSLFLNQDKASPY